MYQVSNVKQETKTLKVKSVQGHDYSSQETETAPHANYIGHTQLT